MVPWWFPSQFEDQYSSSKSKSKTTSDIYKAYATPLGHIQFKGLID